MLPLKTSIALALLLAPANLVSAQPTAETKISDTVFPENANIYNAKLPELLPASLAPLASKISDQQKNFFEARIQSIKLDNKGSRTNPVLIFGTKDALFLLPKTLKPNPDEGLPVARISLFKNVDRLNPSLIRLPPDVLSKIKKQLGGDQNDLSGAYVLLNEVFDSQHRNEVLPPLGLPNFQEMGKHKAIALENFDRNAAIALDHDSIVDRHLLGALTPHLPKEFFERLDDLEYEGIVHEDMDRFELQRILMDARTKARPAVYKEFLSAVKRLATVVTDNEVTAERISTMLMELERFDYFNLDLKKLPIMTALKKILETAEKAERSHQKNVKDKLEDAITKEAATLLKKLRQGAYSNPKFSK